MKYMRANFSEFQEDTKKSMFSLARSRLTVKVLGNKAAFESAIAASDKRPVMAWFTASWCGPCKSITPHMEKLSESVQNVEILKIDVDSNGELAEAYEVESVPTFIMFRNKEVAGRIMGASALKIDELVKNNV